MKQIREHIFQVAFSEIGKPRETGYYNVPGGGKVLMDAADIRYIEEHLAKGFEPSFFITRSAALGGDYVVISRQQAA